MADQDQWWQKGLVGAGQIVAIVGGLLVLRIAGDAIGIASNASGRKPKKDKLPRLPEEPCRLE